MRLQSLAQNLGKNPKNGHPIHVNGKPVSLYMVLKLIILNTVQSRKCNIRKISIMYTIVDI